MSAQRTSRVIPLKNWHAHNRKAEKIRAIADLIDGNTVHPDWILVVFFYSIIHKINAYLVKVKHLQGQIMNHPRRSKYVSTEPQLMSISVEYNFLENEFFQIRYDPSYNTTNRILQEGKLYAIKIIKHINGFL